MSDQDAPAHDDPLVALRAQDHRPTSEIWRDRLRTILASSGAPRPVSGTARWVLALLALLVLIGFGWQTYVSTDPPVEDSLPFAAAAEEVDAVDSGLAAVSTSGEVVSVEAPAPSDAAIRSAQEEIVVHVAGAVRHPGLVVGASGWRVNDAVMAAGGAAEGADLDRLNLAAPINDGERLFVPTLGEQVPEVLGPDIAEQTSSESEVINVNSADVTALQTVPGIGPVTAETIVAHRLEHGPFATVDALVAVRGIGAATVEQLRDHVTV